MEENSSRDNREKQGNSSNCPKKATKVQKKTRKRVKGQKDIRTLIKPRKNELMTYSKEFDLICKQSGIDVDPEQLQLAIALSKSLQEANTINNSDTDNPKPLTTKQRKGIIRTTLQEYGFKVPDIKHSNNSKNNKVKTHKRQYKLLLATDGEKQERIASKYAEILFTNVSLCQVTEKNITCENSSLSLYHISTNILYEHIKDDAIYYVDNLVEIPLTDKHHILRDWSEIPGRPRSPVRETSSNVDFKSLACSQEELTIILSGTIKTAQDIVRAVYDSKLRTTSSSENKIEIPEKHLADPKLHSLNNKAKDHITNKSTIEETLIMPPPSNRSCSPDIFDDEVTIIMDKSKDPIILEVREQNNSMDLTECVNFVNCNTINFKQNSCLSQESNKTRMNPNDFMELTGCVTASSQKNIIDVECEIVSEKENCSPNIMKNSQNEVMDLTQSPVPNNDSQIRKDTNDHKLLDDTIIVVDDDHCKFNAGSNLSKLATNNSDVIHLVTSPETSNKLNNSTHISAIDIFERPEELGKKESNNINFKTVEKYSAFTDTKQKCGNQINRFLSDNKEDDAMDLTQSSDSENSIPADQTRQCSNDTPINTTFKDKSETVSIEKQRKSPFDSSNRKEKEYHYGDLCNSPIDDCFYRFDTPLDDIYLNYSKSPNQNDCEESNNKEEKSQQMNLTQSSSSENSVHIDNEGSVKSLDDTIILNDYYSRELVHNEIEVNKIRCVNLVNDSQRDSPLNSPVKNTNPCRFDKTSVIENDIDFNNRRNNDDAYNINNDSDEENCRIDLTQHSEIAKSTSKADIKDVPDLVGETNNFSFNCDNYTEIRYSKKDDSDVLIINAMNDPKNIFEKEKNSSIEDAATNSSQNTAAFEISDDEFNYSIHQQIEDNNSIRLDRTRFDIGGISAIDEFLNRNSLSKSKLRCSCNLDPRKSNENNDNNCQPEIAFTNVSGTAGNNKKTKSCAETEPVSTPLKSINNKNILLAQTPRHDDYVIKTDVTPMPNYEMMTSPERNAELDKFGIKPLKRRRAIQILTHIYDQTHPVMEVLSDTEEYSSPTKIRKRNEDVSFPRRIITSQIDLVGDNKYIEPGPSLCVESLTQKSKSCVEVSKNSKKSPLTSVNVDTECNLQVYEVDTQLPDIRNIECCPEDWVFQKREKAKVHSCRVPLHIAFHNYVSCRQALREAILRYEPINIDDIHKGLVAAGYRYNPKDLLKFMDKKCITVKTADNNRNALK